MLEKQIYKKIFNRTMFLLACENYDYGERVEMKKVTKNILSFDPLFVHAPGKGVDVFYNFSDPKQELDSLIKFYNDNFDEVEKLKESSYPICDKLRDIVSEKIESSPKEMYDLAAKTFPIVAISNMLGDDSRDEVKNVKDELVKKFRKMRKYSDGLLHNIHEMILASVRRQLPKEVQDDAEYILFSEVTNSALPTKSEIEKRKKGYIFHQGKVFPGRTKEDYALQNNIEFTGYAYAKDNYGNTIKGRVAYPGSVKARARIIRERTDIEKIQTGEVLVAAMTTPNMLPAMKKASAFVTNEGGITCHAAIVAREIKKPCIIGTGNATELIKNGDKIEVDADSGVIKIINNPK